MAIIDPSKNGYAIDVRLKTETDPYKIHMLEEVNFHIKTEANLDFEAALARLSPDTEYILHESFKQPRTVIKGVDAIRREFYVKLGETIDPRHTWDITLLMVDDHAVITEGEMVAAIRGSALRAMGVDADPNGFYRQEARHLVIWPFDAEYRLIGEWVYYGPVNSPQDMLSKPVRPDEIKNYSGEVIPPRGLKTILAQKQ